MTFHSEEAVVKMILTFVIASTLAVIVGASMGSGDTHEANATEARSKTATTERSAPASREATHIPVIPATFPEPEAPLPVATTTGPVTPRRAAAFCDRLDLVTHPELAATMVKIASAAYGTPAGLLNGIWETESDHDIDGVTGACRVIDQYEIRNCWRPGSTTMRPAGCASPYIFVGETPSASRWKTLPRHRIGNGTREKLAIAHIATALGISAWSIKGSCGRSELSGRPDHRPTFGGCFGNMQITPSEWEDDVQSMGFGLHELDPFDVCDSMLVSSHRLRKHHDERLARYRKSLGDAAVTSEHDQLSWLWAGRRYYGGPEKTSTGTYERHFKWGRGNPDKQDIFPFLSTRSAKSRKFPCGWKCWDDMAQRNDFSPLTRHIRWRGNRHRGERSYASR